MIFIYVKALIMLMVLYEVRTDLKAPHVVIASDLVPSGNMLLTPASEALPLYQVPVSPNHF